MWRGGLEHHSPRALNGATYRDITWHRRLIACLFFAFQRGMNEPSEEFHLVKEQQQAQDQRRVQDNERECRGQAEVMHMAVVDVVDDVLMIQVIEQAVHADEAEQFVVPGQVEHQQ